MKEEEEGQVIKEIKNEGRKEGKEGRKGRKENKTKKRKGGRSEKDRNLKCAFHIECFSHLQDLRNC